MQIDSWPNYLCINFVFEYDLYSLSFDMQVYKSWVYLD
uniref:Uncharacterized protein n=1 Tax=Setaria italica TaxID=4555 RepID=K4ANW4_SETIT